MIYFSNLSQFLSIDTPSFLRKCSKKKWQNMEIIATCVNRADSVLVQGEMSSVSEDALMLYFSNKKRSQGGEIKSLTWCEKRTSAVITFEDCEGMFSFIIFSGL